MSPRSLAKGIGSLDDDEIAAVNEVLRSRTLFRYDAPIEKSRVHGFEVALQERLGVARAVAVSSGTAALRVALATLGVGCGDEVIVPAFTFIATVNAVVTTGAVPVFCEIDDTLTMDPNDLATKVTPRTAAIMPVHLENVAADMDAVMDAAGDIPVIEDAAQAIGVTYAGRAVGTIGALGAFSLQVQKNITSGEGGAVVTDDEVLALRAARYQDQGGQFITQHGSLRGGELGDPFVGENLRMTEVAGAIAGVQLRKLDEVVDRLRANAFAIEQAVGDVTGLSPRRRPDPVGAVGSSLTWFAPTREAAKQIVGALRKERVAAAQMYEGLPVYCAPAILAKRTASGKGGPWNCAEHPTEVTYAPGMCPQTEDLASRSITVGVGPAFDAADCDDVAAAIVKVARELL
ncbi:MAG TPA: DegT/DnrJ/EryC1/StrS family aminotransferase [Acidimicrobiales bacterium]|nr:DegT/DnrJ/EryC1/StrS family aminotransferase [Acidimicrobiales bacterium]